MRIAILTTDEREPFRLYDQPTPRFHTAVAALLEGFSKIPEVEIHVISCFRQPVGAPEKLAPNIYFHSLVVPKIGWMRTLFQGCIRATRKKIREIQPDIVHGQGTERDCAMDAVFSGFPNVLTIHGNMRAIARVNRVPVLSYNWLAARLEGFALSRTNGVIGISHYTLGLVKPLARKTWLLPNAVDASFFEIQRASEVTPPSAANETVESPALVESFPSPRPSPHPGGEREQNKLAYPPPVGLCVGTVDGRKNQNAFIQSLDSLAMEKKFRLLFASEPIQGEYGAEFRRLVRDGSWCEHIGYLNREQLKARLKTAAFLALPTREDNCPMVVLEAMAAGVPVLASAVGGVPDLIEHDVTGLLCDPDKPETFRAAVTRLLEDRPLAERLAAEAKARARQRFHPQMVAKQHVDIYREIIAANT